MIYKPHIDGLRAVAVVPVVVFHLGASWLPGGFTGVDVFFVISGYLITGILIEDMSKGRYSLLEFYKRRILRILPALLIVILFTLFLTSITMLPREQFETSWSAAAATSFISNVYFWQDIGYFSGGAETKPLLHTWSLAVEEQFYIFFPPILFLLFTNLRTRLFTIILIFSLFSLVTCIVLTPKSPAFSFYLLPTRAWELGIGAALAVLENRRRIPNTGADFLSYLGLACIFGSYFFISKETIFPGWVAAFPCLGAALLIAWGRSGLIGKLLSLPPMIWIGKISYSLYLWHWPLIVFWKIHFGEHLTVAEMIFLGFLSFLTASISTFYIEKPFRSPRFRLIPAIKIVPAGSAALVVLTLAGTYTAVYGMPTFRSHPPEVLALQAVNGKNYTATSDYSMQFREGSCFVTRSHTFEDFDRNACLEKDPSRPNILLFGDSHAAHFWGALQAEFPDINILQATSSGCRPLLRQSGNDLRCNGVRQWVFENYLPNHQVDAIILSAQWREEEIEYVAPTIEYLLRYTDNVLVLSPTVEYRGSLPVLLARRIWNSQQFEFQHELKPGRAELARIMEIELSSTHAHYIDIHATVCDFNSCKLFAPDGTPMQFDYGHFTLSGAAWVIKENRQAILDAIN